MIPMFIPNVYGGHQIIRQTNQNSNMTLNLFFRVNAQFRTSKLKCTLDKLLPRKMTYLMWSLTMSNVGQVSHYSKKNVCIFVGTKPP